LCQPKAVKRLKGIQPFLLFIENQFLELRSMLDIYGDLDLEMVEIDENTFNLISDFSTKSVMRWDCMICMKVILTYAACLTSGNV